MSDTRLQDRPVSNPDDDLLEMAVYAKTLAEFIIGIDPPFTIGIYGEWGAGKTSFGRFLQYYLEEFRRLDATPRAKFINFTAWPHKTSDELWRALILAIARALYEPAPLPTPPNPGPLRRFCEWLTSREIVLHDPSPPPDPLTDYDSLVRRLDRTQGSIAKGSERLRINQEEALMAMVQTALAAMGTLSPLIAGLRGLLGLDSRMNTAELLQLDKSEAVRDRIESVEQFRQLLRDLFARKGNGRCVCVLIDDLDRCMPDMALDLLEAIKILLGEVPCVFIVAADQHLIGQGLRLRFKDLPNTRSESVHDENLFVRKGEEYFEKIIQLGIRLPRPTPQQIHKFVAAQFPQWAPVSDILRIAIGDNPRRLKQYCNWLEYASLVKKAQETM